VRAIGYKAGRTILLISHVGGEETAAAHALLDGNADITVIVSDRGDHTRVIARTASGMTDGIELPRDLLTPLAAEFGGEGGGHAAAGAVKLDATDTVAIENQVLENVEAALGMQFAEVS
jgi:nanoRNase/pAp phosphatase (c-di-AMP/oligoRNAs hydrolase)